MEQKRTGSSRAPQAASGREPTTDEVLVATPDDDTEEVQAHDPAGDEERNETSGRERGQHRPPRPEVTPAIEPPVLRPPEPPALLRRAGAMWRYVGMTLGLAIGLAVLGVNGQRAHLRELIVERAPDANSETIGLTMTIVLIGGLVTWAVLAVLALLMAKAVQRPRPAPRWLAVLLLLLILAIVGLTMIPLTEGAGLGLAARISLGLACLLALGATALGLLPGHGRWVSEHRERPGHRPPSGSRPEPTTGSADR